MLIMDFRECFAVLEAMDWLNKVSRVFPRYFGQKSVENRFLC
jgi:hypothetical protein